MRGKSQIRPIAPVKGYILEKSLLYAPSYEGREDILAVVAAVATVWRRGGFAWVGRKLRRNIGWIA